MNIILTSNEPWGKIWFSKQHYAFELSKLGHHVYFLNPVKKWSINNLFSFTISQQEEYENLSVLNFKNNFPQKIFPKFFTRLNDFLNCLKLNRHIKSSENDIIWWKFDPFRFLSVYPYKNCSKIYHVVDPYMHHWQNKIQAKKSDLIICTSPKYIEFYEKMGCFNIISIPHGISKDEFSLNYDQVKIINEKFNDFVIIVGTISEEINLNLIETLATNNIKTVVIGQELISTKKWSAIKTHKNIHYLGVLHAKEIKHYIKASKAGLIVYHFNNKKTQISRSPLKALNYLSQITPIISSIDTEVKTLKNNGIYRALNQEGFITLAKNALDNNLSIDPELVNSYLDTHLYPKLISSIFKTLENINSERTY